MIHNVSTDVVWAPVSHAQDASDIDEPRARGAYLEGRISWVLAISMMGAAAALFGSYLEYAFR